jgi:UDP-N-acetylmuramoyl-L-alanyl-D-glutamate--2,6-diaminopimelate ligase
MHLRQLFPSASADPDVRALAFDARRVAPGTVFFCVRGFTRDGHDFAPEAVRRGASALVVDHPLGLGVPEVVVPDVRAAMAPAAAALHGDPTARLRVVGITGTSGKTTTSFLVRHLLEAAGRRTALLGTVKSVVAGREGALARTTPEAIDLQEAFAAMADGGDEACVMEVSSHALELHRADAIHWAAAAFTNLSQDHLDFHPTMEAYFQAKRRLFTDGAPALAVVCVDDEHGRRLASELREQGRPPVTVATAGPADLAAEAIALTPSGATFTARAADGAALRLRSPLVGRFNVANALVAVALARALGVPDAVVQAALPGAAAVPGRLQPVDGGVPFTVLVDYSHKPGALEHVLRAARELAGDGRVLVAFGAGGDRDRGKRPRMGEVAARLADEVVVTSDNPRSEDPDAIIAEILAGVDRDVLVEPDRRLAIRALLERALPGDVVVLAGKGDERGQELAGGVVVPFDDVEVAQEELRRLPRATRPDGGGLSLRGGG